MPKLWTHTLATHRQEVREAIMEATAGLVGERGLRATTMSLVATRAGIGRATLYKYFSDVETILGAWHMNKIGAHLAALAQLARSSAPAAERLAAVLSAYARMLRESSGHFDAHLALLMHQAPHVTEAQHKLRQLLCGLLEEAAATGEVRMDTPPAELAEFCLSALAAARKCPAPALDRLVRLVLEGVCAKQPGRAEASRL